MPAERAHMRKVREVLRLKHALGASEREIAVSVSVSRSTIGFENGAVSSNSQAKKARPAAQRYVRRAS
jgi:hypothetical protein